MLLAPFAAIPFGSSAHLFGLYMRALKRESKERAENCDKSAQKNH
jgi:hypothetical protein